MVQAVEEPAREYVAKGAAAALFRSEHPECLLAGPAGTGKTMAVLMYVMSQAIMYPGARILLCRQTAASLAQSVLKTFEQQVLPYFPVEGPYMLEGGLRRENRRSYILPNGSEIFLLGLENVDRTFSMEADIVCIFEVKEVSFETYQLLARCLRNNITPVQQRICDTNPGHEFLWMAPRAGYFPQGRRNHREPGRRLHLLSKHSDNPSITDEYIEELRSLPEGAIRDRMYLGLWVSEEGMIYKVWDPSLHLIDRKDLPEMDWHFASMDFGFRHPGVFQVWGVDKEERMYMVAEIYRTEWHDDQWAEAIAEVRKVFPFRRVVADCEDPKAIAYLNDFLGTPGGREEERIVTPCDKSQPVLSQINMVRAKLEPDATGRPRIFICRDALEAGKVGRDEEQRKLNKPTRTDQEFGAYVFKKHRDGTPDKEEPDKSRGGDDGMDAMRYGVNWKWRKNLTPRAEPFKFEPGTWGHLFKHAEKMRKARKKRRW